MVMELARFLAAFSVAGIHLANGILLFASYPASSLPYVSAIFTGPTPVIFFFVLSGFVMYTAHYRHFGDLRRVPHYLLNRAGRIFPLYWLSLVVMVSLFALASVPFHPGANLGDIIGLFPIEAGSAVQEANPVAWTLRYEVGFYLLFLPAFLPRIGHIWFAIWAFFVFWTWYATWPFFLIMTRVTGLHPYFWPASIISHFLGLFSLYFISGLLAGIACRYLRPGRTLSLALFILASLFLAWQFRLDLSGTIYPQGNELPLALLIFAGWIATAAMAERSGAFARPRFFAVLGTLSYPLYLLHWCVLQAFIFFNRYAPHAVHTLPAAVWFAGLLAVSIAASAFAGYLIDRPLQRALHRLERIRFNRNIPAAPHQQLITEVTAQR